MTKVLLLPVVFLSMLPLQFAYAQANSAETFSRLLAEFGSEEKVKEKLCALTAVNGHGFATYANTARKNGTFDKKRMESYAGMPDMYPDSLIYKLFSDGTSQATAGASGDAIEQRMMKRCMSYSPEEVRNMDSSPAERAKILADQQRWDNAGCNEKMDQLDQASTALEEGETNIDDYLDVVDDDALRVEMEAAAAKSLDLFAIYVKQFEAECGLSRQQIEEERKLEPDAQCLHTVAQLDDLYYAYQDSGNLNKARQTLSSLISQAPIRQQLLHSLDTDENFRATVTQFFDNRCHSL